MKIWVDADACPVVIKEILFKASERTQVITTFVANHNIRIPPSRYIKFIQVTKGFDVADNEIVKRVEENDLVITGDIPLAAEVMEKGVNALNPRGELYTVENIKSMLNMRDFMDTMRSSGVEMGGGPAAMSPSDRQLFSNHLDKLLVRRNGKGT